MKIAFCIFGQLRDEHLTFIQTAGLARDNQADVFISTWARRGSKTTGIIDISQAERMFGTITAYALPASLCSGINLNTALPGFAEILRAGDRPVTDEQLRAYFPDAVIDIEQESLCLDFAGPAVSDSNSLRMLYKIWRCNELKRAAEKRSGVRYDVVVSFRPDIVPSVQNFRLLIETLADGAVHIPAATPGSLSDVLAISNSGTADIVASLFGKALLAPVRPWDMIHHELANHVADAGLQAVATSFVNIDTDPARQTANRHALLSSIEQRRIDPSFYPSDATWTVIERCVRAAIALSEQGDAEAARQAVAGLDLSLCDLDLLRCAVHLTTEYARVGGDRRTQCAATLLGIVAGTLPLEPHRVVHHLRHSFSLDQLAGIVLDVCGSEPPGRYARRSILEPDGGTPELAALQTRFRQVSDRQRVREIADAIQALLDGSIDVMSVQFHRLLSGDADTARAVAFSQEMIRQYPNDWRGHENLGYARERERNYDAARDAARAALRCAPQDPGLMTRLGMLSLSARAFDEAELQFTAARAVWVDERPWGGLVEVLLGTGRTAQAMELIRDGLVRFPNSEWLTRLAVSADTSRSAGA